MYERTGDIRMRSGSRPACAKGCRKTVKAPTSPDGLLEVKPQVSKMVVKSAIEAALKRSAEVDANRITVEADGDKVTLRGAGHDVRQGNPAAASVNQQAEDSSALSFGVRRNRKPLYRLTICLMLSHLSCRPVGASRSQRSLPGLPSLALMPSLSLPAVPVSVSCAHADDSSAPESPSR